jgi:azurin
MKPPLPNFLILLAFVLVGCGQRPSDPSSETADSERSASGSRKIEITGNDQMKFDKTSITAARGEQLDVVLTDIGSVPKEVMGHNWILLKAGADAGAFSLAAATHKADNYIPPDLADEVIAKIDLLGAHQSGQVTFAAPSVPGDYPFLCSFPGHYQAGMHGILTVK